MNYENDEFVNVEMTIGYDCATILSNTRPSREELAKEREKREREVATASAQQAEAAAAAAQERRAEQRFRQSAELRELNPGADLTPLARAQIGQSTTLPVE